MDIEEKIIIIQLLWGTCFIDIVWNNQIVGLAKGS
jgi:hypothetical protein